MVATRKPSRNQHAGHGACDVWGSFIPVSFWEIAAFYSQLQEQGPGQSPPHSAINFGEITAYLYIYFLEIFLASTAPHSIIMAQHIGGGHDSYSTGGFGLDL